MKKNDTYKNIANLADVGVKLLWDKGSNLYLLAKIEDSTPYTAQAGTNWWENDSFELWLCINGTTRALRVGRDGHISGWDSSATPKWPWSAVATRETENGWVAKYQIALNYWQDAAKTHKPSSDNSILFVYNDATAAQNRRQATIGWGENAATADAPTLGSCYLLNVPTGIIDAGKELPVRDTPDYTGFFMRCVAVASHSKRAHFSTILPQTENRTFSITKPPISYTSKEKKNR